MTPDNPQISEINWKENSGKNDNLNNPDLSDFVVENYPDEVEKVEAKKQESKNQTIIETKDETISLQDEVLKNIEKMPNTKEVFDKLVQTILKQYIDKLNSHEWVNLNIEDIYYDVVSIFENLEDSIWFDNIFNWKIDIINNNFLLPKEKGIRLISLAIDTSLFPEQEKSNEVTNTDIENAFIILESGIATLIDISQNSTKEEIKQYIEEFKNLPEIKELLDNNNDLNLLFTDVLPNIANTLDKEEVSNNLKNFLENTKDNIVLLANHIKQENITDHKLLSEAKLNILNNIWSFSNTLINKENIQIFIDCSKKLEIIQSNPILKESFNLLNSEKLTPDDRFLLAKEIFNWVELFSRKNLEEKDVNEYLNNLIVIVSDFWEKIWWEETVNFINKIIWLNTNKSWESPEIEIKSSKELAKLLWDNKDKIGVVIEKYYTDEIKTIDDLIKFLIDSWTIKENVEKAKGKLIEKIRKIINVNLEEIIIDVREEYVKYEEENKIEKKDEECDDLEKIECRTDFISRLTVEIQGELKNTIKDKIKNKENNNLTKEELIDITKTVVVDFLNNNPKEFIDFLKDLWIKIEDSNQEKLILDFSKNILKNTKFLEIINKIISSIWDNLSDSKNIADDIIKLLEESWGDFLNNYLLNNTNDTIDFWVDFLYSRLLNNPENIKQFLLIIDKNTAANLKIDESNYHKLLDITKTHLNPEKLKSFLKSNYEKIISWWLSEKGVNDLWLELYDLIDNKSEFLTQIIQNCEIDTEENCETPEWLTEIDNIDTDKAIDLIYETLENSNSAQNLKLINTIFEKFWLENLKEINLLWQSLWENILLFFNAIDKEDFKDILAIHKSSILELVNNWDSTNKGQILTDIWVDILARIDTDLLQKELSDNQLEKSEKAWLFLTDELKQIINSESVEWVDISIKGMAKKLYELHTLQESGWTATEAQWENIKLYWEKLFDTIAKLLEKVGPDYLAILLEWWDTEESKPNPLLEKFIMNFLSNNLLFSITHGGTLTKWTPVEKSRYISKYFLDKDNRDDFWDTLRDFYK